jgi:hypothetical protein
MKARILHLFCFACMKETLRRSGFVVVSAAIALGCLAAYGDIGFLNSTTNYLAVAGPEVSFVLPPSQFVQFSPGDGDTNAVEISTFNGVILSPALPLQDGTLYSFNPDNSVWQSVGFLRSQNQEDSDLAAYFMNGLEVGSALAATLLGFIAVRRALSIGDNWND